MKFSKMQGLGNDFIVIDAVSQEVELNEKTIRQLCDRHFGIGCDQLLIVEKSVREDVDFRYRIFNSDGGEVEQCGNGARCFVRFVVDQGLTAKQEIAVETQKGIIYPKLNSDGRVTVNMGVPEFQPSAIPFVTEQQEACYTIEVGGDNMEFGVVSMGNPHAVMCVKDVEQAEVGRIGALLNRHPRFPQRVNAGFMQIVSENEIKLRVFERGTGETLACGSGACAAVAAGRQRGLLAENVRVHLRGGDLEISWQGGSQPLWMTGPAVHVFDGAIVL